MANPYSIQLKNGEVITIPGSVLSTGTGHAAVTVTDTASIDFTLNNQDISAVVLPAGVDHQSLGSILGSTSYYHLSSTEVTKLQNMSTSVASTSHNSLDGILGSTSYYHVSSGVHSVLTTGLSSAFATTGDYVPYSGATSNVVLGSYSLSGATGTFSSGLQVNNLVVTSGLTATTGNFSSGINVTGGATIGALLTASSSLTVASTANVTSGLNVGDVLNVTGKITGTSGLAITGATTFSTTTLTYGKATFNDGASFASNVSIGTTTSATLLTLDGSSGNNVFLKFSNPLTGTAELEGCDIGYGGDSNIYLLNRYATSDIYIGTNGLTRMTVYNDGIVNMAGATTISSTLGVTGLGTFSSGVNIASNVSIGSTGGSVLLSLTTSLGKKLGLYDAGLSSGATGFGIQSNLLEIIGGTISLDFMFGYGVSGSLTPIAIIKGTGNVGIGTTGPTSLLDVNGNIETLNTGAYYLGDPTTEGSWRIIRSGNNLQFQRRESSSWVSKGQFTT